MDPRRLLYRGLLRLRSDTGDPPAVLGPKERKELLDRLRRLDQVEEELRRSEAEARRLAREKAQLEERFARYRQRHPETVGVKLGRPFSLRRAPIQSPPVLERRGPGVQGADC